MGKSTILKLGKLGRQISDQNSKFAPQPCAWIFVLFPPCVGAQHASRRDSHRRGIHRVRISGWSTKMHVQSGRASFLSHKSDDFIFSVSKVNNRVEVTLSTNQRFKG